MMNLVAHADDDVRPLRLVDASGLDSVSREAWPDGWFDDDPEYEDLDEPVPPVIARAMAEIDKTARDWELFTADLRQTRRPLRTPYEAAVGFRAFRARDRRVVRPGRGCAHA